MGVRLVTLNPAFLGAGGAGIRQRSEQPCSRCGQVEGNRDCPECIGSGFTYVPAPERHGIGLMFDCPCATCSAQRTGDRDHDWHLRHFVHFANPLDGGPRLSDECHVWTRVGETFDELQLTPSILSDVAKGGCGWHGFIGSNGAAPGEVITV